MIARERISLCRATSTQQSVVARLLQLYLHDFSEFAPLESRYGDVEPDGLHPFGGLDAYWREPDRVALLHAVDDRLSGLVLVSDWSPSGRGVDAGIAEFFVMRKYRGHGLGAEIARRTLETRSGVWEVAVASYNAPALAFWSRVTSRWADWRVERLEGDPLRWSGPIYRIETGPARQGGASA